MTKAASSVPEASQPLSISQTARRSVPYLVSVLALHLLALALWIPSALHTPLLWGVGLTAYLFGLRHAWDADHIAVIDNTVRKLLLLRQNAHGVGLFFSLGHASVVFLMAVVAAVIGKALLGYQGQIGVFGGWVGPLVAGVYLLTVATVNLVSAFRVLRSGDDQAHHHKRRYTASQVRALLASTGLHVELCSYMNSTLFPLAVAARLADRCRPPKDAAARGLQIPPAAVNALFQWVFAAERHLLGRLPLPFGLSVVVVARK